MAAGRSVCGPSGVSKQGAPSSQPVQRQRVWRTSPMPSSRASHARSSGEAFMAFGKSRPVEPVKHG